MYASGGSRLSALARMCVAMCLLKTITRKPTESQFVQGNCARVKAWA